jgi:lysophospholipase L1-like esterase
MYEQTLAVGGTPIPVTVPSIRAEDSQGSSEGQEWIADHLERRRLLNRSIREYAASKNIAWVDLFSATVDAHSGQLAAIYSNDGIHLTTAGYRIFAREVARVLAPLLLQRGGS